MSDTTSRNFPTNYMVTKWMIFIVWYAYFGDFQLEVLEMAAQKRQTTLKAVFALLACYSILQITENCFICVQERSESFDCILFSQTAVT